MKRLIRIVPALFAAATMVGATGQVVAHADLVSDNFGSKYSHVDYVQGADINGRLVYCHVDMWLTESPVSQTLTNPVAVSRLTATVSESCDQPGSFYSVYIWASQFDDGAGPGSCVGANAQGYGSSQGPVTCWVNNPSPGVQYSATFEGTAGSYGSGGSLSTTILP